MKYFARLNADNIVTTVHCVHDNDASTEENGIAFLRNIVKDADSIWKETFTDGTRKNYAAIGFTYDGSRDAFISPQEFASWTLNEDTCRWDPPTAYPDRQDPDDAEEKYHWNEETRSWDLNE